MLEPHAFWRSAFEAVRNPRWHEYESVWLESNRSCAINNQGADACQAVMQTRRLACVEAHSPAITYVADREMGDAYVEHGEQMI